MSPPKLCIRWVSDTPQNSCIGWGRIETSLGNEYIVLKKPLLDGVSDIPQKPCIRWGLGCPTETMY